LYKKAPNVSKTLGAFYFLLILLMLRDNIVRSLSDDSPESNASLFHVWWWSVDWTLWTIRVKKCNGTSISSVLCNISYLLILSHQASRAMPWYREFIIYFNSLRAKKIRLFTVPKGSSNSSAIS